MNTIIKTEVIYLRPSRTIELMLVKFKTTKKIFFLYNYEGIHFRLYNSKKNLCDFLLDYSDNCIFETDNEKVLDDFIISYKLA